MKTVVVEKEDILREFENKLNHLPIICYSERIQRKDDMVVMKNEA